MRFYRLVSGDLMDRTALSCHRTFYYDGQTSLLMLPVYGLAALIRPAYYKLARFPVMVRGIIYSCGIFFVEFLSGSFFQKLHICPWDYSHVPLQYKGVIRLDYAPLWFFTGLFFEWLLRQNPRKVS